MGRSPGEWSRLPEYFPVRERPLTSAMRTQDETSYASLPAIRHGSVNAPRYRSLIVSLLACDGDEPDMRLRKLSSFVAAVPQRAGDAMHNRWNSQGRAPSGASNGPARRRPCGMRRRFPRRGDGPTLVTDGRAKKMRALPPQVAGMRPAPEIRQTRKSRIHTRYAHLSAWRQLGLPCLVRLHGLSGKSWKSNSEGQERLTTRIRRATLAGSSANAAYI